MTGIVIFISGSLAALMVYQGLRADRNALLVLERKEEIEAQSRAFSELASKTALWDPDDTESLEGLTEIVSAAMAVRRTSVWGYHKDEKVLRCGDSFDRETSGHTRGTELSAEDYPQLFEDLVQGKDIIIADTAADSRTSELHRVYLEPLGCASLLAIPVMSDGKLAGSIWFEHEETIRAWNTENLSFAGAVAGMLALRLSTTGETYGIADQDKSRGPAADLTEHKPAADSAAAKSIPVKTDSGQSALPQPAGELPKGRGQKISFAERLLKRGLDQSSVKADVFEDVTVLVLRFTDPFALAEYFGGDHATTAVDHLICQFEDLFDAYRIDYWKILSDQIICATGLADHSNQHAHATADLALSLQDKCSQLFADLDKPMEYKIGIDLGGIMGSPVGRRRKSYNIWGEAVIAASMMADQSVTGGIQVSETTYRHLQRNYLFKVRGRYYLPNIGEISTYLLTGRL